MKKIGLGVLFIAIIFVVTSPAVFAEGDSFASVTFDELEVDEPAILTGNPFHFLKDVGRRFKSFFVSDKEDAAFERVLLAEKAAEVKKLYSLGPGEEVFLSALGDYQAALTTYRLTGKTIARKNFDFNEGRKTLTQLMVHLRMIDEICQDGLSGESKAVLLDVQAQLSESFNLFVDEIIGSKKSLQILEEYIAEREVLVQLRDAEILILFSNLSEDDGKVNFSLASLAGDIMDRTNDWLASLSASERVGASELLANMAGRSTLRSVFLD